jgi:hypothetical protein
MPATTAARRSPVQTLAVVLEMIKFELLDGIVFVFNGLPDRLARRVSVMSAGRTISATEGRGQPGSRAVSEDPA